MIKTRVAVSVSNNSSEVCEERNSEHEFCSIGFNRVDGSVGF